jgi:transaldolase|tara:strand:- start:20328 stop:21020 length:693 start_codon:yes stop_codon:yes gene_type:complete
MQSKIEIYHDGPTEDQIINLISPEIKGFTFNPSIFKKLKISNYLDACKKYASLAGNKPISLEVIADTEKEIINQAKILSTISDNVYVKVPVMLTTGETTYELIENLVNKKIQINVTAILTMDQILKLVPIVKDTNNILSIFVGRIYDSGIDGENYLKEIIGNKNRKFKYLWASARMAFDIIKAERSGFDIITLTSDLINKYNKFGKDLNKISNDTVKQFYNDAVDSGFKI